MLECCGSMNRIMAQCWGVVAQCWGVVAQCWGVVLNEGVWWLRGWGVMAKWLGSKSSMLGCCGSTFVCDGSTGGGGGGYCGSSLLELLPFTLGSNLVSPLLNDQFLEFTCWVASYTGWYSIKDWPMWGGKTRCKLKKYKSIIY